MDFIFAVSKLQFTSGRKIAVLKSHKASIDFSLLSNLDWD